MSAKNRLRQNQRASGYYIDGNTVRKYEPAPREEKRKHYLTEEERRERQKERVRRAKELRREHQKDVIYTFFLLASVVMVVASCLCYLNFQSRLTRMNSEIAKLESELSTVVNENLAMEEQINSAVDLAAVYNKAVNEFGMTAITEGQIYYYSNENQDYVKQYEQIPSEN